MVFLKRNEASLSKVTIPAKDGYNPKETIKSFFLLF